MPLPSLQTATSRLRCPLLLLDRLAIFAILSLLGTIFLTVVMNYLVAENTKVCLEPQPQPHVLY